MHLTTVASSMVRRLGWGLADQAASSLTNFALTLLVARQVSTAALGIFAIVFSTYMFALGVAHPITSDPLVIRFSASSHEDWKQASRAATGTAIVIGAVAGALCAFAGWVIGGPVGSTLTFLGLSLPGLLLHDALRFAFFAKARGVHAFLNDCIWGLTSIALFVVAISIGRDSVTWLTALWGSAAGIASLVGLLQARVVPAPRLARVWYTAHKDLSIPLIGESITNVGYVQVGAYIAGAIAGLAAVGSLRGAAVLLGPTNILIMGLGLVAVPEAARSLNKSIRELQRTSIELAVVAASGVLLWGGVLFALPDSVGVSILGETWEEAHALLIPFVISTATMAFTMGAAVGLRALGDVKRILRTRVIGAALGLTALTIGAVWAGAIGIAILMAGADIVVCGLMWRQNRLAVRTRFRPVELGEAR